MIETNTQVARIELHRTAAGAKIVHSSLGVEAVIMPFFAGIHLDGVRSYGFFEIRRAVAKIAESWGFKWQHQDGQYKPKRVREWYEAKIARGIAARLRDYWTEQREKASPDVVAVQRAVFGHTFTTDGAVFAEEFYRHPRLVADTIKYRAAAIAAVRIRSLLWQREDAGIREACLSPEYAAVEAMVRQAGGQVSVIPGRYRAPDSFDTDDTEECVAALTDWPRLFSYNGKSYRSLNRTLMNLPGGIPVKLMDRLTEIRITRPFTSRLELIARLAAGRSNNARVFEHATAERIKKAMELVSPLFGRSLSPRKTRDVAGFVRCLQDFPDPHNGNVVGLAEKSVHWHRHQLDGQRDAILQRLGADRKTALPAGLPDVDGVRLLSTVGEIVEEGRRMDHCVAGYADRAVWGEAFVFHIEYKGEHATAAADHQGRILDVNGPGNKPNAASKAARRLLGPILPLLQQGRTSRATVAEDDFPF